MHPSAFFHHLQAHFKPSVFKPSLLDGIAHSWDCELKSSDHIFGMTVKPGPTKPGRPRTGWTQIGVKIAPNLLDKIDAWRASQGDVPARPEAVRRLLKSALADSLDEMPTADPTFRDRDRVHSRVYGIGTIIGPVADRSSSPMFVTSGSAPVRAATVRWDDATWGVSEVAVESLALLDIAGQSRPG